MNTVIRNIDIRGRSVDEAGREIETWINDTANKLNLILNNGSGAGKKEEKARMVDPYDFCLETNKEPIRTGLAIGSIEEESGCFYRKWKSGILEIWGYRKSEDIEVKREPWVKIELPPPEEPEEPENPEEPESPEEPDNTEEGITSEITTEEEVPSEEPAEPEEPVEPEEPEEPEVPNARIPVWGRYPIEFVDVPSVSFRIAQISNVEFPGDYKIIQSVCGMEDTINPRKTAPTFKVWAEEDCVLETPLITFHAIGHWE